MDRPRISTVASAALASALAFYIITRSGLAGTLAGAAVASMISTGTAHWVGGGLDRCSTWWLERRRLTGEDEHDVAAHHYLGPAHGHVSAVVRQRRLNAAIRFPSATNRRPPAAESETN